MTVTAEGTIPAEDTPLVPGSPEYDAAMAAKFDKATGQTTEETTAVPARPDHIPEKFWDAEKGEVRMDALLKSYSELEKARGKPAAEPTKEPAADPATATADEAQQVVEAAGLDFTAMSQEFMETGELSEDTYKSLEGKGIPKEMVDSYIAGQQALAEQWNNTGYEVAGGKDQYSKMIAWAADALSPSEKLAFNSATQGDVDQMKLAVAGLKQRYEAENGKAPGLLGGDTSLASNSGYQSRAQMTADMKNPLYKTDPAFRTTVERKLGATTSF